MHHHIRTAVRHLLVMLCGWVALHQGLCWGRLAEPRVRWTCKLKRPVDASPVPYPSVRPDSVIVAAGGYVARIDRQGRPVFEIEFGPAGSRGGLFDAAVADLDGDGTEELIVGHNGGYLFALNARDGRTIWQHALGHEIGGWRSANPADLDGDGRPEILIPARDGWLRCLNADGTLRWRSRVEACRLGTPSVGDLDHDGVPEIVYGSATRHLIALRADGRLMWDTRADTLHLGRTKPIIADLDRDGEAEVYAAGSNIGPETGLVSVRGRDGRTRWYGKTRHKAYMARTLVPLDGGALGVLIGDKANSLVAYGADGRRLWQTQVRGHGVWTTPSVADVDGDGHLEIVVSVRDTSERGKAWHVLDLHGRLLGSFKLPGGGGFGAPLVADIDGDGVLEIVLASRSGQLTAFTFGGATRHGSVFATGWRGIAYQPTGAAAERRPSRTDRPRQVQLAVAGDARYGNNAVGVEWVGAEAAGEHRQAVELTTRTPTGIHETQVFRREGGGAHRTLPWRVRGPGEYRLTARLLDLDAHTVLGTGTANVDVQDPLQPIAEALQTATERLERIGRRVREAAPHGAVALAGRRAALEAKYEILASRIASANPRQWAAGDRLAEEVAAFLSDLLHARAWADLISAEVAANRAPCFVLWQDDNPWDNKDPRGTLPPRGDAPTIDLWAFGNETESIAVNVANLTPGGLAVRWEPGTITGSGTSMPAHTVVSLHHVLWVPSRFGEVVPDLLPPLGDDYLIDVAPGEVEQVWMNISTGRLAPGDYTIRWPVRSFDRRSLEVPLTVRLHVSEVRLPEKSRFAMGCWSKLKIGDLSTVDDLNAHGQTVWYQLPLPTAVADTRGELVGELDWGEHDQILKRAKQIDKLFYGGIPTPSFPPGAEVTDSLRRTARRNYLHALVAHLQAHGLGWSDFMVYPADEPGLFGTIDHYMRNAEENKKLDPRLQNYANPWGAITLDDIRRMAPITDVWQPGMETVYVLGKKYVEAMRAGGKPVWMYTPPGNARVLRPLGFYRAQPWLAFRWGIEGGGWWIYHSADLWATHPDREPGYGAVASDGRSIVDSRRWEASRDGIEDYNMLSLLRDRAGARPEPEVQSLLDEATAYVERTAFPGIPREAGDYDLDFHRLMAYRTRIRHALERLSK